MHVQQDFFVFCVVFAVVGTGASCIYPLLGARLNSWRFTASEIDPVSVDCAIKNVHDNSLDASITGKLIGILYCLSFQEKLIKLFTNNLSSAKFKKVVMHVN